tara:strand:+ start:1492 stop:1830 length:339 start_codon:yes stop_codon:yes gene_type:complete
MQNMNTFIFRAITNSRNFDLKHLHYCISNYASIDKIVYYPNYGNDYANIFVNNWREHSKVLIENIYFHKEAYIDINKYGLYWKFTPIGNEPSSKENINNYAETKNKFISNYI